MLVIRTCLRGRAVFPYGLPDQTKNKSTLISLKNASFSAFGFEEAVIICTGLHF
jgi:hypothetical protein